MLEDFLAWAWERHHNVLSWYIRPLFILPYIWFAYRRQLWGLVVTVIALATSMFWFPAPEQVDPMVEQFLAAELAYLAASWTPGKLLLTLTVPAFFVLLAVAFWRRSWWWGLAVVNAAAIGKVAWSLAEAGRSGWAVAVPALVGLAVCNAAVILAVGLRRHRERSSDVADGRPTPQKLRGS